MTQENLTDAPSIPDTKSVVLPDMTRIRWVRITGCASAALVLAGAAVLALSDDDTTDPRLPEGLTLTLAGFVGLVAVILWLAVKSRIKPMDALFERGRSVGYEKGYRDGRREARPVMVRMRCPECGAALTGEDKAS